MSEWIRPAFDDVFNLKNIAHIWVEKSENGYFLVGEMIHNRQEVILSLSVDSREEAWEMLTKLIGHDDERMDKR